MIMYPPRPKNNTQPHLLAEYQQKGIWCVQRKFNGSNILIHVKDGEVRQLSRHGHPLKQFSLSPEHVQEILSLNIDPNVEYWLNGELLNNKTKSPYYKGRIVLFDLLQEDRYLFGVDLLTRLNRLEEICRHPTKLESKGIALEVSEHIWLAETWVNDFHARYMDFIDQDEIEGVMLKQKNSVLNKLGLSEYEVNWMIRCRKPAKNYKL